MGLFVNFDPFTTFNCNSTNEDKAFKATLELPTVIPDPICSCLNSHIVGHSLVNQQIRL